MLIQALWYDILKVNRVGNFKKYVYKSSNVCYDVFVVRKEEKEKSLKK